MNGPDSNLRKRYLSWYMIAPVVLVPAWLGGIPFATLVCAMTLYCLREFYNVAKVRSTRAYKWVGRISGTALVVAALVDSGAASASHIFYILPVFIIMLVLTIPIFLQSYEGMLVKESFTILGILYFGWFLAHLVFLRQLDGGFGYVVFLSTAVIFNDVLAYTAGRLWGRTKLTPLISPKKTVEGAIGGLAGSLLAASIFRFAVPALPWPAVLAAAVLIGIAAPLGDLIISVIKRDMAVKDSGNLIPGHGGLLDRCDSLIFATPIFYYFVLLVMHFR